MKRCPQCDRVENDEALKFCRVDGATLVSESSGLEGEAGTAQLGVGPDPGEVHTSILPHKTDAGITRATGPTTTLPPAVPATTGALAKPKSRKAILIAVVVSALFATIAAIAVNSYLSRRNATAIESIAVMPFVNDSGSADLEFLSDGMTETLISSLTQLPNLNVKSRSTVFRYKGKQTDTKTLGRELNVQAILTGRVVPRGEQFTLSLELVDVTTENAIWSQQYNRKQSDLVSLQSEIARDVSSRVKAKLSSTEETKVAKSATSDPEAYQAYLKGRYYWNRRTAENIRKAIEQFKSATDRDPNYALAYAGLADCYALLPEYAGTPSSETIPQAKVHAERAIAIDESLAEPHATLGTINRQLWQWAEAEKEFKRAIEINPNYATAYHWYSILLLNLGRKDEALAMIQRAHKLDPLSSIITATVTWVHLTRNNYQEGIENSLRLIDLDPNFGIAYDNLGLAYLKTGRNAEAVASFEKAAQLTDRWSVVLGNLGHAYAVTGKRSEALAIIKELEENYTRRKATGQSVATVYAGLNDKDKAFEWLEKDYQNRDRGLAEITASVPLESLRNDPRFKSLLKRMGLPE